MSTKDIEITNTMQGWRATTLWRGELLSVHFFWDKKPTKKLALEALKKEAEKYVLSQKR